jgi:hypothetical protein
MDDKIPRPRGAVTNCHKLCGKLNPVMWSDGREVNGCVMFNAYTEDITWRECSPEQMKRDYCGQFCMDEDSLDVLVWIWKPGIAER